MSHGTLSLWVRSPNRPWGLLESVSFDDNKRRKAQHRQNVLSAMQLSLIHWMDNYHTYRDAAFCIEEKISPYYPAQHVQGVPRIANEGKHRPGGLKRKVPSWLKPVPKGKRHKLNGDGRCKQKRRQVRVISTRKPARSGKPKPKGGIRSSS